MSSPRLAWPKCHCFPTGPACADSPLTRIPWSIAIWLGVLSGTACVPPNGMLVDTSNHPEWVDDDVRFRTTYYFRVFDECIGDSNAVTRVDHALYRFRMTGKAHSLTTRAQFESGTLHKTQIDPFGATIRRDEKGSLVALSQDFTRRQYVGELSLARAREVLQLRGSLSDEIKSLEQSSPQRVALQELADKLASVANEALQISGGEGAVPDINAKWGALAREFRALADKATAPLKEPIGQIAITLDGFAGNATSPDTLDPPAKQCRRLRKGFQIMGPEGVADYDQDSRLMMAMSTSGKPLISTLEELSGRMQMSNAPANGLQLPLAEARRMANETELELLRVDDEGISEVIAALGAAAARLITTTSSDAE